MALFSYTALNIQNKKLVGTIEAENETAAREELNKLGFSILELQLFREKEIPKSSQEIRFNFEGLDKNQKKIIGTIDAQDDVTAYIRLTEEYSLRVTSFLKADATPEEKNKTMEYLADLQKKYEEKTKKEKGRKKITEILAQKKQEAQEKEKKELLLYVDKAIQTIDIFLNEYGADMKPEEREIIRSYINQLLRIKDSTNLAHIRTTCENMLKHIAEKEIFLKEAKKSKAETAVKLETRELLETLEKRGLKREIDFWKILSSFKNVPLVSSVISYFQITDPEILELRKKIKEMNHRIFELWKLLLHAKEAPYKKEIKETMNELRMQKKRLKWELAALKFKKREEQRLSKPEDQKSDSLYFFVSVLLAFYLIFYFAAFPLVFNNLNISSMPESFHFYKTTFLRGLLLLLFILHIMMTIRRASSNKFIGILLYPIGGIIYLLFIFNFVF